MPFTAAHPALVLPFLKSKSRFVSATGLVIGSMAPDFEYFMKMRVSSQHSHTLLGLLYFNLPASVLIALVFHLFIKKNLIDNLPLFLQSRFQDVRHFDFISQFKTSYVAFLLSATIGSATHLLWDSFTHNGAYFVRTLPIYHHWYLPLGGVNYPLFFVLQQVSSVVGVCLVGLYIIFKERQPVRAAKPIGWKYWLSIVLISSLVISLRFALATKPLRLGNVVVSTVTALCCGVMVGALLRPKPT